MREVCVRNDAVLIVGAGTNDTRTTIERHHGAVASDLADHIIRGETTKQATATFYDATSITADDVAQIRLRRHPPASRVAQREQRQFAVSPSQATAPCDAPRLAIIPLMEPKDVLWFDSIEALRAWLHEHHADRTEAWVGNHKKATGKQGFAWSQLVDELLCVGWIDSQSKGLDEERFAQRVTPRKPGSNWSKVNVAKVAELVAQGRMLPAGLTAFEGRDVAKEGVYSFEQPEDPQLAREQQARLEADAQAWALFSTQAPSYQRTCRHWITSAKKPETRERRLQQLIDESRIGRRLKQFTSPPRRRTVG